MNLKVDIGGVPKKFSVLVAILEVNGRIQVLELPACVEIRLRLDR